VTSYVMMMMMMIIIIINVLAVYAIPDIQIVHSRVFPCLGCLNELIDWAAAWRTEESCFNSRHGPECLLCRN